MALDYSNLLNEAQAMELTQLARRLIMGSSQQSRDSGQENRLKRCDSSASEQQSGLSVQVVELANTILHGAHGARLQEGSRDDSHQGSAASGKLNGNSEASMGTSASMSQEELHSNASPWMTELQLREQEMVANTLVSMASVERQRNREFVGELQIPPFLPFSSAVYDSPAFDLTKPEEPSRPRKRKASRNQKRKQSKPSKPSKGRKKQNPASTPARTKRSSSRAKSAPKRMVMEVEEVKAKSKPSGVGVNIPDEYNANETLRYLRRARRTLKEEANKSASSESDEEEPNKKETTRKRLPLALRAVKDYLSSPPHVEAAEASIEQAVEKLCKSGKQPAEGSPSKVATKVNLPPARVKAASAAKPSKAKKRINPVQNIKRKQPESKGTAKKKSRNSKKKPIPRSILRLSDHNSGPLIRDKTKTYIKEEVKLKSRPPRSCKEKRNEKRKSERTRVTRSSGTPKVKAEQAAITGKHLPRAVLALQDFLGAPPGQLEDETETQSKAGSIRSSSASSSTSSSTSSFTSMSGSSSPHKTPATRRSVASSEASPSVNSLQGDASSQATQPDQSDFTFFPAGNAETASEGTNTVSELSGFKTQDLLYLGYSRQRFRNLKSSQVITKKKQERKRRKTASRNDIVPRSLLALRPHNGQSSHQSESVERIFRNCLLREVSESSEPGGKEIEAAQSDHEDPDDKANRTEYRQEGAGNLTSPELKRKKRSVSQCDTLEDEAESDKEVDQLEELAQPTRRHLLKLFPYSEPSNGRKDSLKQVFSDNVTERSDDLD